MYFFATAAKGTETALRDELLELGFSSVRADRGGVHFAGPRSEGYRACLWSRIAVRVLEVVGEFACENERALYDGARALDFSRVLTPKLTLSVSAAARSSRLSHTQYIAQLTKDAIVDQLRDRFGERPDVNRSDPDLHVFVHLLRDQATLYLDYAGAPLHLRGYRLDIGEAPLKENLAAAVLRLTGFDPEEPLVDPMCGSGTFLIEGALWATRRAPGLLRERFGFERWADFDAGERQAMQNLREQARSAILRDAPAVVGCDISAEVLGYARENARRAGVEVNLAEADVAKARPTFEHGTLVTNPPYGERLATASDQPRQLARLVDRFFDFKVGVFTKAEQLIGRTRRKPRLYELYNGDIACALRAYLPLQRRQESTEDSTDGPTM